MTRRAYSDDAQPVVIRLEPDLLEIIDKARGTVPRTAWIIQALSDAAAPLRLPRAIPGARLKRVKG